MKNKNHEKLSIKENRPSDWFEPLYAKSNKNGDGVPWANMKPHPSFINWLNVNKLEGNNKSALVIGCGLGDDAIKLESLEFKVTAFDVSKTAIKLCKERFPKSKVNFIQADILKNQPLWEKKFDFILEIFTIQALPPKYEKEIIKNISNFLSANGQLVVIAEVSKEKRSFENGPPWVLTSEHIELFKSNGLKIIRENVEKSSLNKNELNLYTTTFKK